jgi:hypothetical protein
MAQLAAHDVLAAKELETLYQIVDAFGRDLHVVLEVRQWTDRTWRLEAINRLSPFRVLATYEQQVALSPQLTRMQTVSRISLLQLRDAAETMRHAALDGDETAFALGTAALEHALEELARAAARLRTAMTKLTQDVTPE